MFSQAGTLAKKTTADKEIDLTRKATISNSFWNIEATRGLVSTKLTLTDRFKVTYSLTLSAIWYESTIDYKTG